MRAGTRWVALCVLPAFAVACSKGKKGGVAEEMAPGEPNEIEILTWTKGGPDTEWEKFEGTFGMKTAVITWLDDQLFLVLDHGPGGCKVFESAGDFKKMVRASISLEPLADEYKTGASALDGTSIAASDAVILARGFNSLLMLMGQTKREVSFESGSIKTGETVIGSVDLDDKDDARKEHSVIKGRFKAVVCEKKEKKLPEKEPLPKALGKCPAETKIDKLESSIDLSAQGPFDWSTFTIAKSLWGDDGAKLEIFISNQDYEPEEMGSLVSPVEENGHAFLALTLYNGDKWVTIGEYKMEAGFEEAFSALGEIGVKGRAVSPGFDQGSVRIIDMRGGKVCGDFEIKGTESIAKGTFVAPLAEK